MTAELIDRIRELCSPLTPIPTDERSAVRTLPGIRAVLFDVYGTLLISASGDVGTDVPRSQGAQTMGFSDALHAAGLSSEKPVEQFFETIRAHQQRARDTGAEHPEVDIVAVWQEFLDGGARGLSKTELQRVAVEFECRVNPVWPMPHAAECLAQLRGSGRILGIVSNAQFYTPLTLEALLCESPEHLGFAGDLQFFSYEYGQGKPSPFLFEQAVRNLERRGISARETLYVGNDMLKDVATAASVGFRTALFAGDKRSLRRHAGDARVAGVSPDVTLTNLDQLKKCLD